MRVLVPAATEARPLTPHPRVTGPRAAHGVGAAVDGGTYAVRRTRSGDAWVRRERARLGGGGDEHSHGAPAPDGPVVLGMPTLRG